ncbi:MULTISPECIES: diguanylate cyclase [Gammaproteobacteria]|uniref:diguanylate cyclase n=1 Tax=Gammaproteobacteria TaxID=1236 RepID=UPI000DCFE866|nr:MULTISPECIES: diguanylate cyclase [Gammaproteobacteria]RTE85488.1 diguanylate cyclase [Aliidiomarina sp. B3213]TCZ89456.1 diguanylate cyclase [Lysobacter sp. N42]
MSTDSNNIVNADELRNPSRYMTLTYVVSLSLIAILSLLVHLMLDRVIAQQSRSGELINISGQQRMISQRASLFTLEYLNTGNQEARRIAEQALQTLESNHLTLIEDHLYALAANKSTPFSAEMEALYFEEPHNIHQKIEDFTTSIRVAISQHHNSEVPESWLQYDFLAMAREPLLTSLDTAVQQYEIESGEKVEHLRQAQGVVLWIIIITILVEALFIFRPMVKKVTLYAEKLKFDAYHDPLTGIANRRAFNTFSQRFFTNAKRYDSPLSLITLDIDKFKSINDTYGHDIGDEVIKIVGGKLIEYCRESDIPARTGGEEFSILLPHTDQKGAISTAEKIRSALEMNPLLIDSNIIPITASIGVSTVGVEDNSFENVLKRTDTAMYEAKNAGRNRVRIG